MFVNTAGSELPTTPFDKASVFFEDIRNHSVIESGPIPQKAMDGIYKYKMKFEGPYVTKL